MTIESFGSLLCNRRLSDNELSKTVGAWGIMLNPVVRKTEPTQNSGPENELPLFDRNLSQMTQSLRKSLGVVAYVSGNRNIGATVPFNDVGVVNGIKS